MARRQHAEPLYAARLLRKRRIFGKRRTNAHRGALKISCGVGRWHGNHCPSDQSSSSQEFTGKCFTVSTSMYVSNPTEESIQTQKFLDVVSLGGSGVSFQNAVGCSPKQDTLGSSVKQENEAVVVNDSKPNSPSRSRADPQVCLRTRYESTTASSGRHSVSCYLFRSFTSRRTIPSRQFSYHLSAGDNQFVPWSRPSQSARGGNARS